MNFGIVVAIGVIIIVTRLASWAQKQERIARGQLPGDRPASPPQQGLLDVLRDLDQQLGDAAGQSVQRRLPDGRVAGARAPVTTAVRGPGVQASTGPLGESLGGPRGTTGPLGESLGGPRGRTGPLGESLGGPRRSTGPLGEPIGPEAWGTARPPLPARPAAPQAGLPAPRVPGQVPARRGQTAPAVRGKTATAQGAPTGPIIPERKSLVGARPAAFDDAGPKIERPQGSDAGASGRRLAHALLQTPEGRQAAFLLTEIFGPPVARR